jgi:hypothetical protein
MNHHSLLTVGLRLGVRLAVCLSLLAVSTPALADYWGMADAPDWQASAGYTRQSWAFATEPAWQAVDLDSDGDTDAYVIEGEGYGADAALENTYGGAFFIRSGYGDSFSWDWVDEGPMDQEWTGLQGMIGGMGIGSLDFRIAGEILAGHGREIWVQYVAFIPNGSDGDALSLLLATDGDFSALQGSRVSKTWEQIHGLDDQGGSGEWWRVTELWRVDTPVAKDYIRIVTAGHGTANMIDSVDILTRAVDAAPPEVTTAVPADGDTDVALDASVCLFFSKRMVTASAEGAFSIAPEVQGGFEWSQLDSLICFIPQAPLAADTLYTITMDTTARDTEAQPMAQAHTVTFRTTAYEVPAPAVDGAPSGTVTTDEVYLTLSGSGVFGYRYRLDGGDWSDTLAMSAPLTLTDLADGFHTLEIEVLDSRDAWFAVDPITWATMTPPTVVVRSPTGSVSVPDSIRITFSEPMDAQSVETAFSLTPAAAGSFTWEGVTLTFTPDMSLAADLTYTVALAASAADLTGNPLEAAVSWDFTTLQASTLRCPVEADTYVLFGGMGGGVGYPQGSSMGEYKLKAGAVSIVDARVLMRFDLSPITDLGLTADQIVRADLVYTMLDGADGMDVGPPAAAGTPMYGFIHVLDTETREKTGETVAPFLWTEAAFSEGYVNMDNKPWYAPGAPWGVAEHVSGPDSQGQVEVTNLVLGWLEGRWANNGLELRDRDDRSDSNSDYGDGYSWHLASREDEQQGPYLMVTYDEARLRILDPSAARTATAPGETRILTAAGGDADAYQWQALGPDGSDRTAGVLSAATGTNIRFTAPAAHGLTTIILSDGSQATQVAIGVGLGAEPANPRAPLYLDTDITAEEAALLETLCADLLVRLGRGGSLDWVLRADDRGLIRIGGTGLDDGAQVLIVPIDRPAALEMPLTFSLGSRGGGSLELEMDGTSLTTEAERIYAVLMDTGRRAHGNASNIYFFGLYDDAGTLLPAEAVTRLRMAIPFNSQVTTGEALSSGTYAVLQADSLADFFSGDEAAAQRTISTDAFVAVDTAEGQVSFDTSRSLFFGTVPGDTVAGRRVDGGQFETGDNESLGKGCFIRSLHALDRRK